MSEELRIVELMRDRNMTQTQLAEKMGITRVGLAKAISGNTTVSTLRKVADALDVPITSLFYDSETFFAMVRRYGVVSCFEKEEEFIAFALQIQEERRRQEEEKKKREEERKKKEAMSIGKCCDSQNVDVK